MEESTRQQTHASLPFVARPIPDEGFIIFTSEPDGFEALLHQGVSASISLDACQAAPNEIMGLLAGRVLRDERGPYTLVLAAEGARQDEIEATTGYARFSASGRPRLRARLELSACGLDIVGWYQSHPANPARFSSADKAEQLAWNDPNHLGLIIGGKDALEPLRLYRGPGAARLTRAERPTEPTAIAREGERNREVNSSSIKEDKESVHNPPEAVTSQTVKAIAGGKLRFLAWTFVSGLLGMMLSLLWFDYRIIRIEERLENEKPYKASVGHVLAQILSASCVPVTSTESRTPPKAPDNRLADNPLTRAHPLIPGTATMSEGRRTAPRNLKKPTRDLLSPKSPSRANKTYPAAKP